jgi:uncharacterized CHY-type Zn-finger protein
MSEMAKFIKIWISILKTFMCKHILNVQAAIRAQCCKKWYDCSECHNEVSDHELKKSTEMTFACKVCKKVFRKDMLMFEGTFWLTLESDEYCPHCDNKYVLDAVTKEDKWEFMMPLYVLLLLKRYNFTI